MSKKSRYTKYLEGLEALKKRKAEREKIFEQDSVIAQLRALRGGDKSSR